MRLAERQRCESTDPSGIDIIVIWGMFCLGGHFFPKTVKANVLLMEACSAEKRINNHENDVRVHLLCNTLVGASA